MFILLNSLEQQAAEEPQWILDQVVIDQTLQCNNKTMLIKDKDH